MRRTITFIKLITITLLLLSACGAPPKPSLVPGPALPNLNLSGGWNSPHFGFMELRQRGLTVNGKYEGIQTQEGHNGTFTGRIEGDLLWIEWRQPGLQSAAILPKAGRAWLRIKERGARLEGKWGYDESREDGGIWVAEKSLFHD